MPLNIIRNDITRVSADAIVNTANPLVTIGSGVDQAIYEAAGEEALLAERAKIGPMRPGQAAATPAFKLDARYIIHTVGPVWQGGDEGEREAVASCYRESLKLADELHCTSIAFPLISTGNYGFPKDEALRIAINEISSFLFTHDMTVYMVVYSREAFVISGKAFADIKSYIEDQDVKEPAGASYINARRRKDSFLSKREESPKPRRESFPPVMGSSEPEPKHFEIEVDSPMPMLDADLSFTGDLLDFDEASDLEDILNQKTETFRDMLFRIIDRKGLTDPEVYKKANLDRKLFSKIRSSEAYLPKKKTVLALAIALELNMDETIDLMARAGLALNPNSRFDLIVGYCITHKIYNIFDINTYLFEYDQPLLGA